MGLRKARGLWLTRLDESTKSGILGNMTQQKK